jgi:hypothetical protein
MNIPYPDGQYVLNPRFGEIGKKNERVRKFWNKTLI